MCSSPPLSPYNAAFQISLGSQRRRHIQWAHSNCCKFIRSLRGTRHDLPQLPRLLRHLSPRCNLLFPAPSLLTVPDCNSSRARSLCAPGGAIVSPVLAEFLMCASGCKMYFTSFFMCSPHILLPPASRLLLPYTSPHAAQPLLHENVLPWRLCEKKRFACQIIVPVA